jgi:hypothetical protein
MKIVSLVIGLSLWVAGCSGLHAPGPSTVADVDGGMGAAGAGSGNAGSGIDLMGLGHRDGAVDGGELGDVDGGGSSSPDGAVADVDAALPVADGGMLTGHDAGSDAAQLNACGGTAMKLACPAGLTGQCNLGDMCAHPNTPSLPPCWNDCPVLAGASLKFECAGPDQLKCAACACK